MCKTFDVTVVTKCNGELDPFMADANILFKFRESQYFVRMMGIVLEPRPFMIVLGETVQDTLQHYLRQNTGYSFRDLTRMVSEVFYLMIDTNNVTFTVTSVTYINDMKQYCHFFIVHSR